jgi:tRNA pseudouridine55 synthase
MAENKTYICEITLGNRTDTYDKYGNFLYADDKDYEHITVDMLEKALTKFTGQINQTPPAYSAIKINGVRAYDLAREGIDVQIKPRIVNIYSINIKYFDLPRIVIEVNCSKGTYIRSLCNDVGEALGCGAYMSFLLRSETGNFDLDSSYVLEDITCREDVEKYIFNIDEVLKYDSVYVRDSYTSKLLNGNQIILDNYYSEGSKLVKVYLEPDRFVAIGKLYGKTLSIEKLLV